MPTPVLPEWVAATDVGGGTNEGKTGQGAGRQSAPLFATGHGPAPARPIHSSTGASSTPCRIRLSPWFSTITRWADQRLRSRRIVTPFALRRGVTERMQAYLNMPVGFGLLELTDPQHEQNDTVFGLGDISTGVNYLLRKRGRPVPRHHWAPLALPRRRRRSSSSRGYCSTRRRWEPAFGPSTPICCSSRPSTQPSFSMASVTGTISSGISSAAWFSPGEELNYNFGVGFAINDCLTLSTIFLGTFRGQTRFDAVTLPGTSAEPLSVRFALTAVASTCYIVEPFVRIGLTPDAPQRRFRPSR